MTMIDDALFYRRDAGYSLVPIRFEPEGDGQVRKKPMVKWTQYQEKHPSPDDLKKWFEKWPDAGIAVITGKLSGIMALDLDTYKPGYDAEKVREALGAIPETPTFKTPRGGLQHILQWPGERVGCVNDLLPGVDVKGDGGLATLPPSRNGVGVYEWLPGLSLREIAPAACMHSLLNIINNNIQRPQSCKGPYNTLQNITGPYIFSDGVRDENLFHIALCLAKTGNSEDYIRQTLAALMSSWGEHDKRWIDAKIQSAIKRLAEQDRNLKQELKDWWTLQTGYNFLTNACKALQPLTKQQTAHIYVINHRLCKEGFVEKYGDQAGCYRRIEHDFEVIDYLNAPTEEFPITLPLDEHKLFKVYPGNIGVVAGFKGAGKTAYALNVVKQNMHRHKVYYQSSEMGDSEFKSRLLLFDDMKLEDWKFTPIMRHSNWADVITGEKVLWIIDYLEMASSELAGIADEIRLIHSKLKEGVAIIFIQKDPDRDMGRGKYFSMEKSRFYLALDPGRIKIVDAKAWRTSKNNPRGKVREFNLQQGSHFVPKGYWTEGKE